MARRGSYPAAVAHAGKSAVGSAVHSTAMADSSVRNSDAARKNRVSVRSGARLTLLPARTIVAAKTARPARAAAVLRKTVQVIEVLIEVLAAAGAPRQIS